MTSYIEGNFKNDCKKTKLNISKSRTEIMKHLMYVFVVQETWSNSGEDKTSKNALPDHGAKNEISNVKI